MRNGPPPDWPLRHVSAYASAHPWEDWAETWAHYLHMVDALDTAAAIGHGAAHGRLRPFGPSGRSSPFDVYRNESFDALIERWVPLTLAMNDINRSMGHEDFYPFVIPEPRRPSSPSCIASSASRPISRRSDRVIR